MASHLPKPPAKELAAIAARAAAAGKKPTQAAILATWQRNQARSGQRSPGAPKPPPSALDKTAIAARAAAAGKKPTQAAVDATYARNKARMDTKASAMSAPIEAFTASGPRQLPMDPKASPANPNMPPAPPGMAPGTMSAAQGGPLAQANSGSAAGRGGAIDRPWLRYLATGPRSTERKGSSGQMEAQDWRRAVELFWRKAGLPTGPKGFGYDDEGKPLSDAALMTLLREIK